jgi:Family of unknown function (DUF5958)
MSLADTIRINQLIRGRIDFDTFDSWYTSLSPDERSSLISTLFFFAYQAGVDEATWQQAATIGEFGHHAELVRNVKSFHLTDIGLHDGAGFDLWLETLSPNDKNTTFRIGVFLFGVAEGNVFRNETAASCNHWWHRDLLDVRVLDAIRNDPEYYRTSMKHDAPIKSTAA